MGYGLLRQIGVDETALDMEWLQRFGLLCPIGSNEANFIKEAREPLKWIIGRVLLNV